jgi:CRISPR-associated protein Csc1
MVYLYSCQLELHDSLYYATREIGRLYETEPVIHNYALCYALGLVVSDTYRYFCSEQVPQYEEHLTSLNEHGIYVTPAQAIAHTAVLNTWKYANNNYHVEMKPTQKNIPSFGRTKEIAPESIFEGFIFSANSINLPKWIRLGKWMSKAEVNLKELTCSKHKEELFTYPYPLNPLDVMFTHQVVGYDVINMPPVSLIRNVQIRGEFFSSSDRPNLKIPARMSYSFG